MEHVLQKRLDFKRFLPKLLFWILLTALLVVIIGGFAILFRGNQTTKLLFGMADAGHGYLDRDWMANTKDPLRAFSWIVKVTYPLDIRLIYLYQFILVAIFLYSMVMIVDHTYQIKASAMLYFIFLAVYLSSYSGIWPFQLDLLLHDGVANQSITLYKFLPNSFASFLFLSILLFLKKKPYWAVLSLAVACNLHTNYLVIGAVLVSAYLAIDFLHNRDFRRVMRIGGLALALVLPVVISYVAANQGATAAQLAEANRIVAEIRIPHHTQVSLWWGGAALFQALVVLSAILVTRRKKVFLILLFGFLLGAGSTLAMFIRPSNRIAILQLWRVSVILVPLASGLLIGAMVSALKKHEQTVLRRWKYLIIPALILLLVTVTVFGVQKYNQSRAYDQSLPAQGVFEFVNENGGPGEVYLLPPLDNTLEPFRLETGQPIYINWKSHPWNTDEVLEWYQRINAAEEFYAARGDARCPLLSEFIQQEGITHVVMPIKYGLSCEGAKKIFINEGFSIYSVQP